MYDLACITMQVYGPFSDKIMQEYS